MGADATILTMFAGIVAAVILLRASLRSIGIPAIVAFLALGAAIQAVGGRIGFAEGGAEALHLLGKVGVAILLFRVGLESNPAELLHNLRSASWIWLGNVAVSFAAGYAAAHYLVGFEPIPSLVIGAALTATSVGVPGAVWCDAGKLRTDNGERFLDVAELDDVSGIVAMALVFAILPELRSAAPDAALVVAARRAGIILLKLAAFAAACFLYSRYVERHVTNLLSKLAPPADVLIGVVATALIIAGLAGMLGLSVAVGAFLAGLAYSRDPRSSKLDQSLATLYELFVPFFFISVGFSLHFGSLGPAAVPFAILAVTAVVSKLVGAGLPAIPFAGAYGAAVLGVSMVPRAEICLLIAQRAQRLGPEALPREGFTALVLISGLTVLAVPIVLRAMLRRAEAD